MLGQHRPVFVREIEMGSSRVVPMARGAPATTASVSWIAPESSAAATGVEDFVAHAEYPKSALTVSVKVKTRIAWRNVPESNVATMAAVGHVVRATTPRAPSTRACARPEPVAPPTPPSCVRAETFTGTTRAILRKTCTRSATTGTRARATRALVAPAGIRTSRTARPVERRRNARTAHA